MQVKPPPWIDKMIAFRTTLDKETDRGCTLMAAAYLDTKLEELLRQCCIEDQHAVDDILGQSKPLGTFSVRIDLAYALGHLSKLARQDLHLVRRIRNEFAHNADLIDFTFPAISSRCRELHYARREKDQPTRQAFTSAVFGLLGDILAVIEHQLHPTVPPDIQHTEEQRKTWLALRDWFLSYEPESDASKKG